MKPRRLKCWIGNLDGSRYGLVIATSQKRAAKVLGMGLQMFNNYFAEADEVSTLRKSETLYTKPISNRFGEHHEWVEGYCKIERRW
jgi:hypothetical protein